MSEHCSLCQVVEVGPYCPEHGLVHRPFSIGGRYDVEELIGARVAWVAFAAHDRTAGRSVVVNVLRPQRTGSQVAGDRAAQQRFLRAASALGKLTHEYIVGIVDFGWDDALGVPYLVVDRLPGQTAAAMVRRDGPLRWQEVVPLLGQICRALVAAQAGRITDGSLTAEKVLVVQRAGRPAVKLCDFGFTGVMGTPERGADTHPRDDIYGIGTIAHELLTGRPPPEGSSARGALSDDPVGMNQRFPALALPDQLDALVQACRLRNPMLRPSLAEIQAALLSLGTAPATWGAAETQVTATQAVAEADPLAMPVMIGSYRVVGELGAGGTGRVYLGQHPVIGSKVAIKVLLPEIARSAETVERFIQEARASSQIGSPHIPRYFDFGTTPAGLPYAIMEYFDGETLGERLARVGTMSIAETAQVLTQVATALLMAHEAGLIHRDLKPDNILLVKPDSQAARSTAKRTAPIGSGGSGGSGESGGFAIEVKVLDFGIAKMVNAPSATKTQSGYFLGTPFYCAPEQVFGHTVDARTDVYSLGATAFEMLTGAPPFVGQVPQILSSKATEEAPDLLDAGVPAAVAHTIGRMLAREPEHRAPSMVWVLDEVARWAQVEAPADRIHEVHEEEPNASRMFARAATALAAGGGDPATTSQAMRVLALPHGRARRRTALVISFGVLAMAAAAVLIGVSSSRRATPASSRSHDVQEPSAGSATTRGAPSPAPAEPQARAHDTPAPAGGSAAQATAPAEDSAEPGEDAASDPGRDPASSRGSGQAPNGDRADEPADDRAASGSGVPHRPRAKPPAKKPPAKKPPAKKPPPGTSKDVLIVDPFSSGR